MKQEQTQDKVFNRRAAILAAGQLTVFLGLSAPSGFVRLTQAAWWLKEQTALTSHASMLAASRRLTVWRTSAPNKFLSSSKLLSKSI